MRIKGVLLKVRRVLALMLCVGISLPVKLIRGEGGLESETRVGEPIADLDMSYLSVNPKIPWGTDPFRKVPGFAPYKSSDKPLVLGGIVYDKVEPMAIVNGESLLEGDEIEGRVVEKIGRNFVILKKGDSLVELALPPAEDDE